MSATAKVRVSSERPVSEERAIKKQITEERRAKQKWPKTIGACVDMAYQLREQMRAHDKLKDPMEQKAKDLEAYILATFKKSELNGAQGKAARVEFNTVLVPNVKDWDKLYAWVLKTKAFDVLQRRLSSTAVRERWESNKAVPGVEKTQINQMSILKLPSRKTKQ